MEEIFKENPHLKVVYVTSDGQAFYQEQDAKNHAKTLEDKTVEPVHNPSQLEVEDAVVETGEDAPTVVTTEASGTVDLLKLTKAQLNEFAAKNSLTIANAAAKNEILVEEILTQLNAKKQE